MARPKGSKNKAKVLDGVDYAGYHDAVIEYWV